MKRPLVKNERPNLSTENEIMSHFSFLSSFKDKGSSVYEYDNK